MQGQHRVLNIRLRDLIWIIDVRFDLDQPLEQLLAHPRATAPPRSPASRCAAALAARSVSAAMRSATASACARSMRPLRNARSVNSPGAASRAPERNTTIRHEDNHSRATMHVQFNQVFARERSGRKEVCGERIIETIAVSRIANPAAAQARRWGFAHASGAQNTRGRCHARGDLKCG